MRKVIPLLDVLEEANPRRDGCGRVFVELFETQPDGQAQRIPYPLDHTRVEQWLNFELLKLKGKPPTRAAIYGARNVLSELAHTFRPRDTPTSVKEEVLFRVVVHFVERRQDFKREPADMFKELALHAQVHKLLDPGEDLPGSEDALTPMLHRLQPRLAAKGIVVETGRQGGRFIWLRREVRREDTPTPLGTSSPKEVSGPTPEVTESCGETEVSASELAEIEAAAKGGAA